MSTTARFGWVLLAVALALVVDVSAVILVPVLVSVGIVALILGGAYDG